MRSVEFFGLPGSGKSTVYEYLKSLLLKSTLKFFDANSLIKTHVDLTKSDYHYLNILTAGLLETTWKKHFFNLQLSYQNTISDASGLKYLQQVNQLVLNNSLELKTDNKRLLDLCIQSFARYNFAETKLKDDTIFIDDEGRIHRILSLFNELDETRIEGYLNLIKLPDILVIIEANSETCIDRMKKRKKGVPLRLKNKSDQEIVTYLSNLTKVKNHVRQIVSERTKTLIIDSEEIPAISAAEYVKDVLTKELSPLNLSTR